MYSGSGKFYPGGDGKEYGFEFNVGILKMEVDTKKGEISFKINGKDYGVAAKDEKLK